MSHELSENENLQQTEKNLNKFGIKKHLSLQVLANWPKFLLAIISIVVTTSGAISYFVSTTTISKNVNSIKSELKTDVKNEISQYIILSDQEGKTIPIFTSKSTELKQSNTTDGLTDFNSEKWHFTGYDYELTKEGFYCPNKVDFLSWFMWTSKKLLIEEEVQIRFKLKDDTKNDKFPTLFISYGDKSNKAPEIYYTINIFDGDLKTIRVNANKDNYKETDRSSKHEPSLENEILFTLRPSAPSRNLSKITLHPELSFKIENDEQYNFVPEKEFTFGIPLVSIANQGNGKQIGIGISKGDCLKIISSNLQ